MCNRISSRWWASGARRLTPHLRCQPHGGPVAQDLGHARHDLRSIIPYCDQSVRSQRSGVLDGFGERLGPCLLTEIFEQRDLPTEEGLKLDPDLPEHRAGTDDDSAHDPVGLNDVETVDGDRGRGQEIRRREWRHVLPWPLRFEGNWRARAGGAMRATTHVDGCAYGASPRS